MAFSRFVDEWFSGRFDGPTEIQRRAWEVIKRGENALIIAPAGSGKTLAAFLSAIDRLMMRGGGEEDEGSAEKPPAEAKDVRVLYISPLKALGVDVERNLQQPLAQISTLMLEREGIEVGVSTGIRTGDTTPEQRRALVRKPPDILITTPESLYLMLTSKARETLAQVDTVIVDEIHSVAGTKRGAHLSLSLERLDALLASPAQRIGLSATVRPAEDVARFLGGVHPVTIVEETEPPAINVSVRVPVPDMANIQAAGQGVPKKAKRTEKDAWRTDRDLRRFMEASLSADGAARTPDSQLGSSSIWPYLEAVILQEVIAHRTTIVFVNSRGLCEKLTARLNERFARISEDAEGKDGVPFAYRPEIGSTTQLVSGAEERHVIAKAHHGSISKEQRKTVEDELKRGEIPCVVATSSLELGIDMGSVDLVIQVAPPFSVSSGLQRVGRANHQVGGLSQAIVLPRTRLEVIDAAVAVEGMRAGAIERTSLVRSPLDVLAQQTVAAVSLGSLALEAGADPEDQAEDAPLGLSADEWFVVVRRSACFTDLSREAFDAVLSMLCGFLLPADAGGFAPRILWDREEGMLRPRPGAQRCAIGGAGTIPDRGMYPVMLPEGAGRQGRRRVGELDEEMVHESRVGDIITLGTSPWRITQIASDRVLVEPAPGRTSRLPFWHGEGVGRPFEDGFAKGAFLRAAEQTVTEDEGGQAESGPDSTADSSALAGSSAFEDRIKRIGLDGYARDNLLQVVRSQWRATGAVPTDQTLVLEVCPDEMGDLRIILHSPFGKRVHEPWALAVSQRILHEHGYCPQVLAQDDGIVIPLPEAAGFAPSPDAFLFSVPEIEEIVRASVSQTSVFAARFRECAARALLMPSQSFGKRAPLWLQRLKGSQLLEAARGYPDLPIFAEAVRECLQDVYDMEGLRTVMEQLGGGAIRILEVHTTVPSPFSAPLLFGYVAEHLYEGDLPTAERRASLATADPTLLNELLGAVDIGDVVDEEVVAEVAAELQRLRAFPKGASGQSSLSVAEAVADLLRVLGPLTTEEVRERIPSEGIEEALSELERQRRAYQAVVGGQEKWVGASDAPALKKALGVEAPAWALQDTPHLPADPLKELVARYGRTHGPFTIAEAACAFGLGEALIEGTLKQLRAEGKLLTGSFKNPFGNGDRRFSWIWKEAYDRIRARSLAKARSAVSPVSLAAYMRYLFSLQGIGGDLRGEEELEPLDRLAEVIARFEGVFLEAGLWEAVVFPARVSGYKPGMLDELLASRDICWVGKTDASKDHAQGDAPSRVSQKLVAFFPTDSPFAPLEGEQLELDITEAGSLMAKLWAGKVMTTSFEAVRVATETAQPKAALPRSRRAHSRRGRSRQGSGYQAAVKQATDRAVSIAAAYGSLTGTWYEVIELQVEPTLQGVALVESALDRYAVVTRDTALLSGLPGGLPVFEPYLKSWEERGRLLRGMFVEGLGPVQYADLDTVEELRTEEQEGDALRFTVLSAEDPACIYGQGLPWPGMSAPDGCKDKPRRVPDALVVFRGGSPVIYTAPRLRYLLMFTEDEELMQDALDALVRSVVQRARAQGSGLVRKKLLVQRVNGRSVLGSVFEGLLQEAGFVRLPDGLRFYPDPF